MLAMLFDIHGNLPALEAVVTDASNQGAIEWLLGGDFAVFGGWPAETVETLTHLRHSTWIRGNVDRWAATQPPSFPLAESGVAACREMLDAQTISRLGSLPESADLGAATRAWHASPKSDMQSFMPDPLSDEAELLEGVPERRLVFGHFHVAFERQSPQGIALIAPGSVGMPFDGDHRAAYALLHEDGQVERRRVAYDYATSANRIREVAGGARWGEVIATRIERASS